MNNSFKIANSINMIDNDLILEADEIVDRKSAPKKTIYLRYAAAAAACLCVAGGAAVIAKTRTVPEPVTKAAIIKMNDIHFNDPVGGTSASLEYDWDSEMFDSVLLDTAGITEYYGRDITPNYIPKELIPGENNGSTKIYSRKDGSIANDRTVLRFYDGYDEYDQYGDPKRAENEIPKGFELIAAKYGPLDLCCRVNIIGMEASRINGTDVYFAHLSIPIGKIANPSGYYDKYIAEFELDDVSYRVTTVNLEAEEIVKIVSSIIFGEIVLVEE